MEWIFIIVLIVIFFISICREEYKKGVIERAKTYGILICGEHYKVYTIYRESSCTDGLVYVKHHNVRYFGEMMLAAPDGRSIYISEKHLRYCLKVRKHDCKKIKINGKWTSRWSEWKIDPDGDDIRDICSNNDIYLGIY